MTTGRPPVLSLSAPLGTTLNYVVCHRNNEWRALSNRRWHFATLGGALFSQNGAEAIFRGSSSLHIQIEKHGEAEYVLVELNSPHYLITDGVEFTVVQQNRLTSHDRAGLVQAFEAGGKLPFRKAEFAAGD